MGGRGEARSGTNQSGFVRDYPWLGEQRDLRQRRAQEFEDESRERIGRGREFVEPSLYDPQQFGNRVTESSYGRGREGYQAIAEGGVTGASYGRGRETSQRLADDTGYSGSGRETYANLAQTGGFTPETENLFTRRA